MKNKSTQNSKGTYVYAVACKVKCFSYTTTLQCQLYASVDSIYNQHTDKIPVNNMTITYNVRPTLLELIDRDELKTNCGSSSRLQTETPVWIVI